jgi:hypothetical protein
LLIAEEVGTGSEELFPCLKGVLTEALVRGTGQPLLKGMQHRLGIRARAHA